MVDGQSPLLPDVNEGAARRATRWRSPTSLGESEPDAPDVEAMEHQGARHASMAVGPTVSFRELRDQLSLTALAARGRSPTCWQDGVGDAARLPLCCACSSARCGKVGADAAVRLAARRDGRPDAGLGAHPRRDHGDRRRLPDRAAELPLRALAGRDDRRRLHRRAHRAVRAPPSACSSTTSRSVLAYSTVSQLGFMFIGVGVGACWAGVFHLVTHACFKACLFLGSGSVIHGMHRLTHAREHAHGHGGQGGDQQHSIHGHDEHKPKRDPRIKADPIDPQDMRNMGGLARSCRRRTAPISSRAGRSPASPGRRASTPRTRSSAARSPTTRRWCRAGHLARRHHRRDLDLVLHVPLLLHDVLRPPGDRGAQGARARVADQDDQRADGAGGGEHRGQRARHSVCLWLHRAPIFEKWLEPVTNMSTYWLSGARAFGENHMLEIVLMCVSVGVAALGWFAARMLYFDMAATERKLAELKAGYAKMHALVFDKYRVDELYNRTFVRAFKAVTSATAWFDANVVDGLVNLLGTISRGCAWVSGAIDSYVVDGAVNGVADLILEGGRRVRRAQTGRINNYVLGVVVGIVVLVVITSLV